MKLSTYLSLALCNCRDIYISPSGQDNGSCSTKNNPCNTIQYAVAHLSLHNDFIRIDGSSGNFTINEEIILSKPLNITFTSYNGVACIKGFRVSSERMRYMRFLAVAIPRYYNTMSVITIYGIHFRDISVASVGDTLELSKSTVNLRINQCRFQFTNNGSENGAAYWLTQSLIFLNNLYTVITFDSCTIQANYQAGIIFYPTDRRCSNFRSTTITFRNTRIEDAVYSVYAHLQECTDAQWKRLFKLTIVNSVIISQGIRQSQTPQVAAVVGQLHKNRIWLLVYMKNSSFQNLSVVTNTAAVMDIRGPSFVQIENCTFKGNIGNRGGALSFQSSFLTVTDSHFEGNKARVPTVCAQKDQGGSGGAIFVGGVYGSMWLKMNKCTFFDNLAACFGSAVYFGYFKTISVQNTKFKMYFTSHSSSTSIWLSYSRTLAFDNVSFEAKQESTEDGTLFSAKAKHFSFGDRTPYFTCPIGSTMNISDSNMSNSEQVKTKEVKCQYCPKDTYTLKPSHMLGFDRLKRNKAELMTQCQSCSFGAVCKRDITPKPNFWGYEYNNKAIMLICPSGYCCQSKSKCVELHSCNGMRTGRLCGKCKKGYFQSIFTSDCIHEKYCKSGKFWGLTVCSCLLFTILFIFLQDIFLISVKLLSMTKILDSIKMKFKCLWDTLSCMKRGRNETETIRDEIEQDTELMHNEPVNNADGNVDQTSNSHLDDCTPKSDNNSMAGGLIKIIFFFYQVHSILTIYKSNEQIHYLTKIKGIVISVFNLNLHGPSQVNCPYPGMDSIAKLLIKGLFPINCLVFAVVFLFLVTAISSCFRKNDIIQRYTNVAKAKVLTAILQLILLGYSTLTSSILSLVTCISLANGHKILYIDGSKSCYQHWQYALLSFLLFWAIPLIHAIHKLPSYMRNREISILRFYVVFILPLPFAVYTTIKSGRGKQSFKESETEPASSSMNADNVTVQADTMSKLLNVITGPFRYNASGKQQIKLSWEPGLLLQRILLSLCHTFIIEPTNRSLVLLLFVMIMANLNFMYRPFNSRLLNATNGATYILLCITAIINAIYAFIYENGAVPKGPLVRLLAIFDYMEVAMILTFPLITALALIILVSAKFAVVVGTIVRYIVAICRSCLSRES